MYEEVFTNKSAINSEITEFGDFSETKTFYGPFEKIKKLFKKKEKRNVPIQDETPPGYYIVLSNEIIKNRDDDTSAHKGIDMSKINDTLKLKEMKREQQGRDEIERRVHGASDDEEYTVPIYKCTPHYEESLNPATIEKERATEDSLNDFESSVGNDSDEETEDMAQNTDSAESESTMI